MFFKVGVLKSFAKFTGKHLCWNLFLIKLLARRPEKRLQFRQFPVKFAEFLITLFFTEHLGWLLLNIFESPLKSKNMVLCESKLLSSFFRYK